MKYSAYEFAKNRDEFVACRQHAQPILYCRIRTAFYLHSTGTMCTTFEA